MPISINFINMQDIVFDTVKREIVLLADGSDVQLTNNPSIQNGGILLRSRCAILINPMIGVGMDQFMNGHPSVATYEMNRWQAMAKNDGATVASWSGSTNVNGLNLEQVNISYL